MSLSVDDAWEAFCEFDLPELDAENALDLAKRFGTPEEVAAAERALDFMKTHSGYGVHEAVISGLHEKYGRRR